MLHIPNLNRRQKFEFALTLAASAVAVVALLAIAGFVLQITNMDFTGMNVIGRF